MSQLKHLLENNKVWAAKKQNENPNIFKSLAEKQAPKYLWIGCSDSRVPASEILGLEPGELFVHRNIANLFPNADFNSLSVLEYAVTHLHVEHVIVCGHYGCGGVAAAMQKTQLGLIDNWLRNIRDVYSKEKEALGKITDEKNKYKRLVELSAMHQALNVCHTTTVQNTWAKKTKLTVHSWVYDLSTGLLKDLDCSVSSLDQIEEAFKTLATD